MPNRESNQNAPNLHPNVTPVTPEPLFLPALPRKNVPHPKGNNTNSADIPSLFPYKGAIPLIHVPEEMPLTRLLEMPPRPGRRPAPVLLSHTPNHLDCPACQFADQQIRGANPDLALLSFQDAARFWMKLRMQAEIKERSKDGTRAHLEALNKFFHGLTLAEINPGHLKSYQQARTHNKIVEDGTVLHPWSRKAGHDRINHELGCLGQILTQARLWHKLRPFYFPLHINKWSPRTVLTEAEELKLWKKAATDPAASLAYWTAVITKNTSAAGVELRGIRLKHLALDEGYPTVYIAEAKNTCRPRKIALNLTAQWAFAQCYRRALNLGSTKPEHYLFPFRQNMHVTDPTRPASEFYLRRSWQALRKVTGFKDLRPHDLRHHCITKMLESGVEPETVRAIAGHVTAQMMEYYAHQRTRTKYDAVMMIESGAQQGREEAEPEPKDPTILEGQLFARKTKRA